ncbi:MAG: hypothetical protein AAF078_10905 [Planctomycetota bacterium]
MGRAKPEDVELGAGDSLPGSFPVVPALAAGAAALVGVGVWVGLMMAGVPFFPPLLIGAMVGLAVMFTDRGDPRMPWVAAGLTVASCWVGHFVVDQFFLQWTLPRSVVDSLLAFLRDFTSAMLSLIGGYLAWVVASRAGKLGQPTPGVG